MIMDMFKFSPDCRELGPFSPETETSWPQDKGNVFKVSADQKKKTSGHSVLKLTLEGHKRKETFPSALIFKRGGHSVPDQRHNIMEMFEVGASCKNIRDGPWSHQIPYLSSYKTIPAGGRPAGIQCYCDQIKVVRENV